MAFLKTWWGKNKGMGPKVGKEKEFPSGFPQLMHIKIIWGALKKYPMSGHRLQSN